jgi:hypothetical protein
MANKRRAILLAAATGGLIVLVVYYGWRGISTLRHEPGSVEIVISPRPKIIDRLQSDESQNSFGAVDDTSISVPKPR